MGALRHEGLEVAGFKVGPDYIDPGYHALATGRPGRNLDPHLCRPGADRAPAAARRSNSDPGRRCRDRGRDGPVRRPDRRRRVRLDRARRDPDRRPGDPGARHLAGVADRRRDRARAAHLRPGRPAQRGDPEQGRLAPGTPPRSLPRWRRPGFRCSGCCLATPASRRRRGTSVWSPPPNGPRPRAASPGSLVVGRRAHLADPAAGDRVRGPAAGRRGLVAGRRRRHRRRPGAPVVAVAGGRAFTFRYAETDELLRAAGCEPVVFDPLTDPALPPGTAGLYLGGGFPEVHAVELSGNAPLLRRDRGRGRRRAADGGRVRRPALPLPDAWTAGRWSGPSLPTRR